MSVEGIIDARNALVKEMEGGDEKMEANATT
jgi:hypothetical protein